MTMLPSYPDLCLSVPLYTPLAVTPEDQAYMRILRSGNVQIDAYCVECGQSSTFKDMRPRGVGLGMSPPKADWMFKDGFFNVGLNCTRHNHYVVYEFYMKDNILRKIGQFPSMEDVAGADIEKFRKILGKEYFAELRRANGLASHGIGIGAFVYLRRIFERLVYQHRQSLSETGTDIPDFDRMRMEEKISALAQSLPPALVKNKATYAILSKGLHELDEDTCRAYFPVVRAAIMQILEQDFQQRESREREKELEREIARINAQLKAEK